MFTYAPPAEYGCSASKYSTVQSRMRPALAGSGSTPAKTDPHRASR
jgi:hypothetical protein